MKDNQTRDFASSTSWEARLKDILWSYDDGKPRFRHERWRNVFDEQIRSGPLSITLTANPLFALPLGEHRHRWTVWLTREAIWNRFRTQSQIAVLPDEESRVSLVSTVNFHL